MKIRIISGVVGLLVLASVLWAGQAVLSIAVTLIALIGLHEFYNSLSMGGYKPIKWIGYPACLPIALIGLNIKPINDTIEGFKSDKVYLLGIFVILVILFTMIVFRHDKFNVTDVALTFLGIFYIPYLFLFIVLTTNLHHGMYYIGFIFIGAWATDTLAYFSGRFFGKTKIMPVISPKKTLEGSIGGVIGCIGLMMLYAYILKTQGVLEDVPYYHYIVLGVLCGSISQIGDWAASAIKRYVKVKDYGSIMPGHGGVLDRFDSILFTAPIVYFYLYAVMI